MGDGATGHPARRRDPAAGDAGEPPDERAVSGDAGASGAPFRREGLVSRVVPFVIVASLAEASVALPPGPTSAAPLAASLALLAAVFAALLAPWDRIPAWADVLLPLAYTGSVYALIEAAGGSNTGISVVLLVPVVWTALFHRPWESAVVVVAAVAAEFLVSFYPDEAPDSVLIRRVIFWGALGAMISVATHGLRGRIRRSQAATARLQGRLRELSILRDRDRIASNLQDTVVQRLFAAGLSLQGIGLLAGVPEISRRIDAVVRNIDEAIKLLRQSIFGLEHSAAEQGLRRSILDVSNELTPALGTVPEVALDGPLDTAVPRRVADRLLATLREALACSGAAARATRVAVAVVAGPDDVRLSVTDNGIAWGARSLGDGARIADLRERASELGGTLEITTQAGDARLSWRVPLGGAGNGDGRRLPHDPGRGLTARVPATEAAAPAGPAGDTFRGSRPGPPDQRSGLRS